MIVRAWKNGRHNETGVGYAEKLHTDDRDGHFKREWNSIILELQGRPAPIIVTSVRSRSFWGSCSELRSREIGMWLRDQGKAPWPEGRPPTLILEHTKENRFLLTY